MVFVTGDIHGDPRRFSADSFPEQKEMTKDDYVIVLGDFGLIWDYQGESKQEKNWLKWLEEKPFTTLFIDGNHENFTRLNDYPKKEWHGGEVHVIRPGILHLMRGYVFDIDGLKCFCFGGASSHDIEDGIINPDNYSNWKQQAKIMQKQGKQHFRIKGVSWWPEEMPNNEELAQGLTSLRNVNWKVDYVFTHCAPSSDVALLSHGGFEPDNLTKYFEEIRAKLHYKKWFFGHYHENKAINDKEITLFEQITRIS